LDKRQAIFDAGYTLVEIWEHEYDELVKQGKMQAPSANVIAPIHPWTEEEQLEHSMTDKQWENLKKFLPMEISNGVPLRTFFNAVLWKERTGAAWSDVPTNFGGKQYAVGYAKNRFCQFKRHKGLLKEFDKVI
jgi:hypothetical protein